MSVKVVIADDSKFIQKTISDILIKNNNIEIVGYAANGIEAINIVEKNRPDVLLLDLLMPEMNGLDAFEKIMNNNPLPIIILSSLSPHTMDVSIQALLMGAFDYIIKPGGLGAKKIPKFQEELIIKVISASKSQIKNIFNKKDLLKRKKFLRQEYIDETFKFGRYINELRPIQDNYEIKNKSKDIDKNFIHSNKTKSKKSNFKSNQDIEVSTKESYNKSSTQRIEEPTRNYSTLEKKFITKSGFIPDLKPVENVIIPNNIVVMGASVGGPRTIKSILSGIPEDFKGSILVVQHLNENFVDIFVNTLNTYCKIKIKVAKHNDFIEKGIGYVAPGGKHMEISVKNRRPIIKIFDGPKVHHCIPSIDILFFSAAKIYKKRVLGIILTGMGEDGVNGLGAIQKFRGKTIAESEQSAVLFGMPRIAIERGYADYILPNDVILSHILRFSKYSNKV